MSFLNSIIIQTWIKYEKLKNPRWRPKTAILELLSFVAMATQNVKLACQLSSRPHTNIKSTDMSYFGIVSKSGGGDIQLLAHMQLFFINSNYDFELLKIDIQWLKQKLKQNTYFLMYFGSLHKNPVEKNGKNQNNSLWRHLCSYGCHGN